MGIIFAHSLFRCTVKKKKQEEKTSKNCKKKEKRIALKRRWARERCDDREFDGSERDQLLSSLFFLVFSSLLVLLQEEVKGLSRITHTSSIHCSLCLLTGSLSCVMFVGITREREDTIDIRLGHPSLLFSRNNNCLH